MSRPGRPRGGAALVRVAVLLVALVVVAAASALAAVAEHARPPSAANGAAASSAAVRRMAARAAATRLLAETPLPPGAVAAASDPSRSRAEARPPERPATPNLVDVHGFWRVPGTPKAVLAWTEAHAPAGGFRDAGGAAASTSGLVSTWDGYEFAPVARVLSYRAVLIEVARAVGGGTALRVDGQVIWLRLRSGSDWVPAGVRAVAIAYRHVGGASSPVPTVTAPRKVKRIVALVNGLPAAQPGIFSCPIDIGPSVRLTFESAASGGRTLATATADGSGCGTVSLRVGGVSEPPLSGGRGLVRRLGTLLDVSFS